MARGSSTGAPAPLPPDWAEAERSKLQRLRAIPQAIHLELGLHPAEHACVSCTAARTLRAVSEAEHALLVWVEVAHVLPGHEGVASPPPWLRVLPPGSESGPVRFLGPPRGDILEGLVRVVEDLSQGGEAALPSEGWRTLAARTHRRHHFRIFASARNPDASHVVRNLARFVHLRPERLSLDVLDVETFPKEARRRSVRHLPTVTIDDFAHFYGPPEDHELLEAIEHVMPSGDLPFPGPKGDSPFGGMS